MFTRFFIDRPIFASVLSIVITLAGGLALVSLPIAMFPQIAPPTVSVSCQYPGASAQVVAETVAAPIEQQVNGVENMMYMSSASTNDGNYSLTVTFKHGIDLNLAQVLVQNRVSLAVPMLPDVIKATGVTTKKRSPDILLSIGLYSPDGRYDQLYLSNYAFIRIRDELARLPGVSDVSMFGQRDYSMRIWLDPDKLAQRGLTAGDVVRAIREQNLPVASGQVGQSPTIPGQQTQVTLTTLGRLVDVEQFEKVVVRSTPDGRFVRIRDVARVELAPKNQDMSAEIGSRDRYSDPEMDLYPVANMAVFQLPDANALETADVVKAKIEELKRDFPEGVDYMIRYDTTPFIRESIQEVFKSLLDSVVLVALVVLLFLQNWRSALIPLIAVPVGIVGTFAVMACFGFSLNNLTLFGLVLAIGIVVDDAIVVVESVEHHIEHGLSPRNATIQAMSEVSAPVIAVGLVLTAVFVPCAFITGITGQFFRQFALTIASATVLSTINSLTLSPALSAMLLKPREKGAYQAMPRAAFVVLGLWQGHEWLGPLLEPLMPLAHGSPRPIATAAAFLGPAAMEKLTPELAGGLAGALVGGLLGWILSGPMNRLLGRFFDLFNRLFTATAHGYSRIVGGMLRVSALVLVVYVGLLVLTYGKFATTPRGFIPSQDMGYLLVNVQLPDSAAVERTRGVIRKISDVASATPGVSATVGITGQSLLLNAFGSNFGTMFVTLDPFAQRPSPSPLRHEVSNWFRRKLGLEELPPEPDLYFDSIMNRLRGQLAMAIPEATISIFGPPPVRGVGRAGGWMFMVEDRGDLGPGALQREVEGLVRKANDGIDLTGTPIEQGPAKAAAKGAAAAAAGAVQAVQGLTSVFRANVPQVYLDVDRTACMIKGVPLRDVFTTLQAYLGSLYVNDFNRFGRTWQVIVQAMPTYRDQRDDIRRLQVRNREGTMVPLGALATIREINGPLVLTRYNMYPAASINGNAGRGVSSGSAIRAMEALADRELPQAMSYEWTEMAYLELQAGNTAVIVFGFSIVMVFLVLAAQFESWAMPLAVILSVPLCMLSALYGVTNAPLLGANNTGLDINIFTQIGLVVLVGLASKNAILIVQFAKLIHGRGGSLRMATVDACRLRLRPIIMTSMAFILGVVPLLFAHGAGAEMRQSLGVAVFSGMLGVTFFGVLLTPVFFYMIEGTAECHLFANPKVRRAGRILLRILLPVIILRDLARMAGRAIQAKAVRPAPRPEPASDRADEVEVVQSK
ncbi:Efflux pump membrane transporter BepE [Aquisphaera giovannonii]|uniref:Efflux pump membrane transporter BepE n=1 Tax=Aquisphaera giovannonii TaxID=406548 RepID=A0A5B9W1U1_9BACT|nr:efflux RND transporter permease subunit [Aquisphaera giovannonii]QEH34229.1 Efflux pump membrane transporter BepE [Aquisphaera giovannonii]